MPFRPLPFRLRSRLERMAHDRATAAILATGPIIPRDDGLVIFSMIGTAVLRPYLVAVKSLWSQLRRGRIVILDDGTLTAQDRAVLAHHCGHPEIISLAAVDMGPFPAGGTWERFLTILDRRAQDYWIQLDSDTVTMGPLYEVQECLAANRSFILPGGPEAGIGILPADEIARALYPGGPVAGHVQLRIESRLDQLPADRGWRYARGCSGFAGFARGGAGRALAADFLAQMKRLIGPQDITLWGTEQVASNFQLANDPNVRLLPARRYVNYWGEPVATDAAFLHFLGVHRHDNGAYRAASRAAIAALNRAGQTMRGTQEEAGTAPRRKGCSTRRG